MEGQFFLAFPQKNSYQKEDYFVSEANHIAFSAVEELLSGPNKFLVIIGDSFSGKTHLANIFASEVGARIITEFDFERKSVQEILHYANNFVIEDLELKKKYENTIFHLYNEIKLSSGRLLMTSACKAIDLDFATNDLKSRLLATQSCVIEKPDQQLIEALVFKFFSDRQVIVSYEVAKFFAARVSRNYKEIYLELDRVYKESLISKRKITINSFK